MVLYKFRIIIIITIIIIIIIYTNWGHCHQMSLDVLGLYDSTVLHNSYDSEC